MSASLDDVIDTRPEASKAIDGAGIDALPFPTCGCGNRAANNSAANVANAKPHSERRSRALTMPSGLFSGNPPQEQRQRNAEREHDDRCAAATAHADHY